LCSVCFWSHAPLEFPFSVVCFIPLLPVAIAALLAHAGKADPEQRGSWRDFLVLAVLGLAVDLRWFESAWPQHLAIFNRSSSQRRNLRIRLIRRLDGPDSIFGCA